MQRLHREDAASEIGRGDGYARVPPDLLVATSEGGVAG
jgi:hypothetical protein